MRKVKLLILLAVLVAGFTNCSNKDAERRIAEMESRLAELENGTATSPTTATTPSAVPTPAPTATTSNVKPDGPLPAFNFVEDEHDFGTIREGEVVTHTFKFTNNGEAPLIIEKAQASCGCTVPVWTRDPIPVGQEGEIQVRFDSKNKTGIQNKTVTITANTYPQISRLRIKTFVEKADAVPAEGPVRK